MCLDEGTFPTVLKKSVVHPIHKSGDRNRVTNYRPISILPAVSKLLERIINSRFVKYMETNKLLSNNQFGFRAGKSTCDAVHELVDYVVRNIDSGKKTIGVFLDLAKAFDTVSVPLLLSKLEGLGVRGKQLKLFEDYLSGRYQCVKIDKLVSSDLPVTFGVPQGSILGPSLFLVYLNGLCGLTSVGGKIISYADDTVLLFSADTWEQVFEEAQRGLNIVCHWLGRNMLTLNADKTQYMTFSMRNSNSPSASLSITAHNCCNGGICQCPKLIKTNSIKYLGVTIDNNLSFKPHIELVTARLRKLIYVFKSLRHVADPRLMKQVYLALGQSILSYCVSVWGGAPKTILKPLEVAQRAILKVSTFRPYLFPTYRLYQTCEVLSIRQLFILHTVLMQHEKATFKKPTTVSRRRKPIASADKSRFKHPFVNRYFCFLGPYLYDRIDQLIDIHALNRRSCRNKVFEYIHKLTYDETENLIIVPH